MSQQNARPQPNPDSASYVPLNSLATTEIAPGQSIEHASNDAFHDFARRAFTSLKNTQSKDWEDRYLRWVAVNRMLDSKRVIRKKNASGSGWQLVIVAERESEVFSSDQASRLEEKTSDGHTE